MAVMKPQGVAILRHIAMSENVVVSLCGTAQYQSHLARREVLGEKAWEILWGALCKSSPDATTLVRRSLSDAQVATVMSREKRLSVLEALLRGNELKERAHVIAAVSRVSRSKSAPNVYRYICEAGRYVDEAGRGLHGADRLLWLAHAASYISGEEIVRELVEREKDPANLYTGQMLQRDRLISRLIHTRPDIIPALLDTFEVSAPVVDIMHSRSLAVVIGDVLVSSAHIGDPAIAQRLLPTLEGASDDDVQKIVGCNIMYVAAWRRHLTERMQRLIENPYCGRDFWESVSESSHPWVQGVLGEVARERLSATGATARLTSALSVLSDSTEVELAFDWLDKVEPVYMKPWLVMDLARNESLCEKDLLRLLGHIKSTFRPLSSCIGVKAATDTLKHVRHRLGMGDVERAVLTYKHTLAPTRSELQKLRELTEVESVGAVIAYAASLGFHQCVADVLNVHLSQDVHAWQYFIEFSGTRPFTPFHELAALCRSLAVSR